MIVADGGRRPALGGGAAAIARDVELEDGGVVDQPVDSRHGHRRFGKDVAPGREGLVGGDQQAAPLVALGRSLLILRSSFTASSNVISKRPAGPVRSGAAGAMPSTTHAPRE